MSQRTIVILNQDKGLDKYHQGGRGLIEHSNRLKKLIFFQEISQNGFATKANLLHAFSTLIEDNKSFFFCAVYK